MSVPESDTVYIGTSEGDVFRLRLGEDGVYFPKLLGCGAEVTGSRLPKRFGWTVGRSRMQVMVLHHFWGSSKKSIIDWFFTYQYRYRDGTGADTYRHQSMDLYPSADIGYRYRDRCASSASDVRQSFKR